MRGMSYIYQHTEMYRIFGPILYDLLGYYESRYNLNPDKIIKYDGFLEGIENIPISGNVTLPKYIMYLAQLPIVQRLKEIKQLSHTYQLFPGAAHSRYEHSLGVMNRCKTLCNKIESLLSEQCSGEVGVSLNKDDKIILDISSFLHDIGHPAWGHALDGITGYVIELLSEMEVVLFAPRKLDTTITIYLLTQNNQLVRGLNKIGLNEIEQKDIKSNLNKIIAQIIIEEEPLVFSELEDLKILKKIHLMTTILGNYSNRGGINADRLDWIVRDIYHANILESFSEEDKKKCKKHIERNVKNDFDIVINNCEYLTISDKIFEKNMNEIRELIYTEIYEGLEKAFIDALFERLVYSSIYIIHTTGENIASLYVVAKAVMGYLLMPDNLLKTYTFNILTTGKQNIHYLGINIPSTNFILKSNNLKNLLKYENYMMHVIKTKGLEQIYSDKNNVDFFREEFNAIEKQVIIVTAENFEKMFTEAIDYIQKKINGKNKEVELLALIYHDLVIASRINSIVSFQIPTTETRIQEKFNGGVIYLLINYYIFRRLDDNFRKIHSISDFLKILKTELKTQPFLFVVTDLLKREKSIYLYEMISDNVVNIMINIFTTLIA